jgi:glycosyltransferase involved in cell wall biosynthesis
MKVAVVIPALNEADCLPGLIDAIPRSPDDVIDMIVVDNGSTDATSEVARSAGARVISEPRHGYGYACAAGVRAASASDVIVFLDGDHSFLPSDLPALLQPLELNQADLVLGSRWLGHIEPGSMPPPQRFGNWLVARLTNWLYGLSITDLGPYRAVRRSLVEQLGMREMTFGWPVEMIVKAARLHARIVEVPVSYRARRAGQSKVSGTLSGTLRAGWRILQVTFRYALR